LEIKVSGGDLEKALKLLKLKLQKDGLLQELKRRRYYEKPSVKMKTKQRLARKRKAKSMSRRFQGRKPVQRD